MDFPPSWESQELSHRPIRLRIYIFQPQARYFNSISRAFSLLGKTLSHQRRREVLMAYRDWLLDFRSISGPRPLSTMECQLWISRVDGVDIRRRRLFPTIDEDGADVLGINVDDHGGGADRATPFECLRRFRKAAG